MEDMLRDPDWVPEHLQKKAEIRAKSRIGEWANYNRRIPDLPFR
jgi:hypothetical protein